MSTGIKIGHAHLKVRDLQRAIDFYTGLLGLSVTEIVGRSYAFLTAGEMHHEIALQAVGNAAPTPPPHGVGLYHVAFEVPDKAALAALYQKLTKAGIEVHPVDHRISWAIYFDDPDGNGLEVYCDTRHILEGEAAWHGQSRPLLPAELLALVPDISG